MSSSTPFRPSLQPSGYSTFRWTDWPKHMTVGAHACVHILGTDGSNSDPLSFALNEPV